MKLHNLMDEYACFRIDNREPPISLSKQDSCFKNKWYNLERNSIHVITFSVMFYISRQCE